MPPKIAIVGAGPAGCTLARLLHLGGIDAVVYEGDASPDGRAQGGTLDLHTATGLAAIEAAGLWTAFQAHARYDGEHMLVCDKRLGHFFARASRPSNKHDLVGQRPEIDRAALRAMLAASLPPGMIQWGRRVKAVTAGAAADGPAIAFADGSTAAGFDLVVGADGAWSKVRAALSDQQPHFAGVGLQEMRVPDAAETAPALARLVNRGSIHAHAGGGRKLTVQQLGDGALHVSVATRRAVPDWAAPAACGYDAHDLASAQAAMLARPGLLADFDPRLQAAVAQAQGATAPRSLYALPVGFRWAHRRGLTILGDAAHLMTPFAGEGVNAALDDARRLAAAILAAAAAASPAEEAPPAAGGRLDAAVRAFEADLFVRAARVARLTDDVLQAWFFTPGAPESVVASVMAAHVRFQTPAAVHPFATAAVHAFYFVYKTCLGRDIWL